MNQQRYKSKAGYLGSFMVDECSAVKLINELSPRSRRRYDDVILSKLKNLASVDAVDPLLS